MPTVELDGIATRYEVVGEGPPLLMFSPGGFDARLEKWRDLGVYARIKLLDHLPKSYRCIIFDRRETGLSGGRIEPVGWNDFAAQGRALLDHLKIERAHLLGGCMGCGSVAAFAVAHPKATLSAIYFWPVGGAKYRINSQLRFARHLAFVEENGLAAVVAFVKGHDKSFGQEPQGGPWTSVIRNDPDFARRFAEQDVGKYKLILDEMCCKLFDRDTAPGAEPEDLLRLEIPALIVPGRDDSHATSAARYLEECLPGSEYWDVLPAEQTEATVPARVLEFLDRVAASGN